MTSYMDTGISGMSNWVLGQAYVTASVTNGLGSGGVTSVTASGPLASSGGTTPEISLTGEIAGTVITDASITSNKLAQMGAGLGQVLAWAGTAWSPAAAAQGGGVTANITNGLASTNWVLDKAYVTASITNGLASTNWVLDKAYVTASGTNAVGATWDSRWVNAAGDTISGDLAVTGSITCAGNWHVGSASNANHLIMENDSSFIMAKSGSGNNLRLMADNANGGQIVMHAPVSMPGMVGRITSVNASAGYVVNNSYCRETSVVIITPVGTTPIAISVVPANGSFSVHGSASCTFNYLIVNP